LGKFGWFERNLSTLRRNLGKFDQMWAKSKSCIPKNIQFPIRLWNQAWEQRQVLLLISDNASYFSNELYYILCKHHIIKHYCLPLWNSFDRSKIFFSIANSFSANGPRNLTAPSEKFLSEGLRPCMD